MGAPLGAFAPRNSMTHGKKYRAVLEKKGEGSELSAQDAIAFLKANPMAKFDESVELHIRLGIDRKKSDQGVRGTTVLPHGSGRTKKVAVITSTKEKEGKDAGARVVGGTNTIDDIKAGKLIPGTDFDVILATPEMMPKLAQIAKILGPKGLMPSPKTETVTQKIAETVEMLSKGKKISFKNDEGGNIHQVIGKLSFEASMLEENYLAFLEALNKVKPEGLKGKFLLSITLSSTMSPGIKVIQ